MWGVGLMLVRARQGFPARAVTIRPTGTVPDTALSRTSAEAEVTDLLEVACLAFPLPLLVSLVPESKTTDRELQKLLLEIAT